MLWFDRLQWVSSPDWTFTEGTVPLITFGEVGFYRPLAEAALRDADIPHRIAFSGPSTASVLGAVAAGIGVALLSSRSIAGEVVPWSRAAHLSPTPRVVNVDRAARGATKEVAKELLTDIRAELGEVPTSAR